jgi:peptidoglycan/LPS O-acetylase OafA/YrhL
MMTVSRKNNFNILRLALAVLVILSHAPELRDGNRGREILTNIFHTISFGEFAVDGFFLLSGYLIVQSWYSDPFAPQFLKKRVLRIYPGFIVASLVCALVVGPLGAEPGNYFSDLSVVWVTICMAALHGPILPPVFEGQPYPQVNGAMWTIWREFLCYMSVLALGSIGALKNRKHWGVVTILIFVVWIFEIFELRTPWDLINSILDDPVARLAAMFYTGGCFYVYRDLVRYREKTAWLALLGLVALLFSKHAAEPALAIMGGYLLFFIAFKPISAFERLNKIPDVSYGVYLYGWPIEKLLLWYFPLISPWILFGAAVLACALLGYISWHWIEKPFLRLKPRRLSPEPSSLT